MAMQNTPETKTCGRCGQTFSCHAKSGGCWCENRPPLPDIVPGADCLCPACLEKEYRSQTTVPKP